MSVAQTTGEPPSYAASISNGPKPTAVGAGGEYTESFSFALPEFRGLVPELGLSYNSSNTKRGGNDNVVAFGWSLDGLSVIERKSVGGGVPIFDAGQDVFLLDGQPLLACKDSAATNVYTSQYPLRYQTDVANASCSAGGNMATRIESYRKIVYSGSSFTVWDPDGTRYVYSAPGALIGDTSANGSANWQMAFNSRWVLTEIDSPQKDAAGAYTNVVTITYDVAQATEGYAVRASRIAYAGYRIDLGYNTLTSNYPQFGTGTGTMGAQKAQLKSVAVYDGTTKIRAYQLIYGQSSLTGTRLLQKIETYGSDFTLSGAAVASGSRLPDTSFDYSADSVAVSPKSYSGVTFDGGALALDDNRDGRDDLFLFGGKKYFYNDHSGTWTLIQEIPDQRFGFDFQGNLTQKTGVANSCPAGDRNGSEQVGPTDYNKAFRSVPRLLNDDRAVPGFICAKAGRVQTQIGSGQNATTVTLPTFSLQPFLYANPPALGSYTGTTHGGFAPDGQNLAANFDYDPSLELIFDARFWDIDAGAATPFGSVPNTSQVTKTAPTADINGDGVSETADNLDTLTPVYTVRAAEASDYGGTRRTKGTALYTIATQKAPDANVTYSDFGDINGDGLKDLIAYSSQNADELEILLNTGKGFSGYQHLYLNNYFSSGARAWTKDINSDGLDDLITQKIDDIGIGYGQAVVFYNIGGTFDTAAGHVVQFSSLLELGDFNGDGLTDFVGSGVNPQIWFSTGVVPNRLVKVTRPAGGTTDITYAPSSQRVTGSNQIPTIQQVVASVSESDGRGIGRTASYTYANGRYDFINRQPLGYDTVTATFDPIAGETVGPVSTVTYLNSNFVNAGAVKSSLVTVGGTTTYSRKINDWAVSLTANANSAPEAGGPFKLQKTRERTATLAGDQLIETTKEYTYTLYGQPLMVSDLGFSSNGSNLATGDDLTLDFGYAVNLSAYITDKPVRKTMKQGTTTLQETQFVYDGLGTWGSVPTEGNLTNIWEWNGVSASAGQRETKRMSHDDWGNILTERDANGNVTTSTFDSPKHLFRTTVTNALSQVVTTSWNTVCQAPGTVTDLNGLTTSFTYDLFCRETRQDLPSGQYLATSYINIGNPTTQYVEKESLSPSATAGKTKKISQEFFDGVGLVYKTAVTNASSGKDASGALTDAIVTLSGYDARGNLSSKSIPLPTGTTTAGPGQYTAFNYDPLDRAVQTTFPDGAYETTGYTHTTDGRYGISLEVPSVRKRDAHCYDDVAANTLCGESVISVDPQDHTIRTDMTDANLTDVGATGTARTTLYVFDPLGRLTGVTDPAGITFAYAYDVFGNRTSATDPGLGTWTMSYDLNGNLVSQTDAKTQVISFTYDALNRTLLKTVGTGASRIETRFTYDEVRAPYRNKGHLTSQEVTSIGAATVIERILSDYHATGALERSQYLLDPGTASARTYTVTNTLGADGSVQAISMPAQMSGATNSTLSAFTYDASGRLVAWPGFVTSATFDLWGNRTAIAYANGSSEAASYSPTRGWLNEVSGVDASTATMFRAAYTRSATGRIAAQDTAYVTGGTTKDAAGSATYSYDYAGRLLSSTNPAGTSGWTQTFTYDAAGRMRTNSQIGTYAYANATVARHAPSSIALAGGGSQTLTYDANGNMLTGLSGKVMTYDNENRPLSVTYSGKQTCYVYGADGARLKKLEGYTGTNCATPGTGATTTLYAGPVEVRNYGQGDATEVLILYPAQGVRLLKKMSSGSLLSVTSTMHYDGLGSVRSVTSSTGNKSETSIYHPFGQQSEQTFGATTLETKGFIGERYDADAGLQYLNARYYDPRLAMFIQPDWWEVTQAGVGTNRFAYSFNDPVNGKDQSGHYAIGNGRSNVAPKGGLLNSLAKALGIDQKSRDAAHRENVTTESEIISGLYKKGYKRDDPLVEEHVRSMLDEYKAIGRTGASAAWHEFGVGNVVEDVLAIGPIGGVVRGIKSASVAAQATRTTQGIIAGGKYSVYVSRVRGVVEYIGQTKNFPARQAAHWNESARTITEVATGLSKFEARALEQAMIEKYGLGNLSNKINSIAEANPIYGGAISVGKGLVDYFGL